MTTIGGVLVLELKEKHHKAMQMAMEGRKYREISAEIGVPYDTVAGWFSKNETFKEEFTRIQEENVETARRILNSIAPDAARSVSALVHGQKAPGNVSARTQLDAAKDILDRVGLKPVEKQEIQADVHSREYVAEWGEEG